MAYSASELPKGFRIRRLQLNDLDRLRLYMMLNDPHPIVAGIPIKTMIILYKIGSSIALALILGIILYVVTVIIAIAGLSINRHPL